MQKIKLKEVLRFLVGGGSAVITDYITYTLFIHIMPVPAAKGISFICGSVIGFIINKYWTFEQPILKKIEIVKYSILYISTLIINNISNTICLNYSSSFLSYSSSKTLAFLVATGISTILNFLGLSFYVFR